MTATTTPILELNNGVQMPAVGLGVFQTPPDETRDAVRAALSAGYRHIDTAAAYGNERQVGEAVHSSELDRSTVFLETKIWIEQLSRVVDEKVKHQAATSSSVVVVSSSVTFTPSLNFTPASTSPTSSWPLTLRQRSWAASKSL